MKKFDKNSTDCGQTKHRTQEQLRSDRGDLSGYILVGVVLDASATPSEPTCSSVKPLLTSSGRAPRTFGYILGDPFTSKVHLINHLIKSYQDTISTSSFIQFQQMCI